MVDIMNLFLNKVDHAWYRLLLSNFSPVDTLMDIGCGNHPQDFIKVTKRHYTVDPAVIPDGNFFHINGTWEYPAMGFMRNNDIHTVVLMDVIEHLDKTKAQTLLAHTRDLVQQIVVFTPLGFMPQEDGEWNTHRSGWYESDFKGWQTCIFPYFHWCDFKGEIYPKPFTAILAIWKR